MKSHLEQIMKERNMTIRSLEHISEVNNVTILKARKNETIERCTLATLTKIADALDISVHELFDDDKSLASKPVTDDTLTLRLQSIENRIDTIEAKLKSLSC